MVKHWVQKKIHENRVQADDNLPLNKKLKIHNIKIVIRSVFEEDSKYYP